MKKCFVIMPFTDPAGYPTGHFRSVYDSLIEPACSQANYAASRADAVSTSNLIMLEVIRQVLSADVAICDLSSANPNVLYELGIRHAAQRPVVLVADEHARDIFDVSATRIIRYNSQMLGSSSNPDVTRIASAVRETGNAPVESFFSLDRTLEHLLSRVRVYAKRTDLTGDLGLKDALASARHLDIVGLAAEAAVMVFREDLHAALSRADFTSRFVLFDPAVTPKTSVHYEALVKRTLNQSPELKRTQAQEVLRLASEAVASSGNPAKMQVRLIRGLPLLYNLWIAGGSPHHATVGHISVYTYDQSRGGPAFRTASADSPLLAALSAEFDYVWHKIAVPSER